MSASVSSRKCTHSMGEKEPWELETSRTQVKITHLQFQCQRGGALGLNGQPSLISKLQASVRLVSQKKMVNYTRGMTPKFDL